MWSRSLKRLDAHCTIMAHGGLSKCKCDRTYANGVRRLVGRQYAWLAILDSEHMTAGEHKAMKRSIDAAIYHAARQNGRNEAEVIAQESADMMAVLQDEPNAFAPEPPVSPG